MKTYEIQDGKLVGVRFVPAPAPAAAIVPSTLVMHYTAGRSFPSDLASMTAPKSPGFAHVLIGTMGEIVQLVRFDRMAYHAGPSAYTLEDGRKLEHFNRFSIGIELTNPGFLQRVNGSGDWLTWYGVTIPSGVALPAKHPKRMTVDFGWVPYTPAQLETAAAVGRALREEYSIEHVFGHDDINQEKLDPGPLFPMARFRDFVLHGGEWRYAE